MNGAKWMATIMLGIGLAGCASQPAKPARSVHQPNEVTQRLEQAFTHWKGTPYRLGGSDRRGMDCSAFVRQAYQEAFDIRLPRTTREQQRVGQGIHSRWLRPGDLLFFRPARGNRHVGIYMGDNQFIHASTSAGVTRSRLDDRYWRRSLTGARRVLPRGFALRSQ